MNDNKKESIPKEIKRYLGFLYDMGYQVRRVDYYPKSSGSWKVVLESQECVLEICNERDEILAYFVPLNGDRSYRVGIKAMIYYLSHEQKFIDFYRGNTFWGRKKQFEELAGLLKEYVTQSAPYFGDNFHNYREDLLSAQSKHFKLAVNRRMRKK
jgi:hypothetical protein